MEYVDNFIQFLLKRGYVNKTKSMERIFIYEQPNHPLSNTIVTINESTPNNVYFTFGRFNRDTIYTGFASDEQKLKDSYYSFVSTMKDLNREDEKWKERWEKRKKEVRKF